MEKLSENRLNTLIGIYEAGVYQGPVQAPLSEEIVSGFLELKQLRAEKRQVCQKGDTTAKKTL